VFRRLNLLVLSILLLATGVAAQKLNSDSKATQKVKDAKAATETRWHTFTGPDRDFIIEFPFKPRLGTKKEGLGETMRQYDSTKGSLLFQLMFWDTGFARTSRQGNQLPPDFSQDMIEQAKQEGWTVIRSQLLSNNLYEQERWTPLDSNPERKVHLIGRHIRRYGREYILTCSSLIPDKEVEREVCRYFFNSFRITGKPRNNL
jgi:hypothetical protein